MDKQQIVNQGLWSNNPAMVQMLGLCPLLAVSNTLINSLVLGVLTIFVLVCACTLVSLVRNHLQDTTRLPTQILIIAGFVTLADISLQLISFELHQRIGLFVALIVTNCSILGRAESFARKQHVGLAALDGLMMGLGFCLAILCLGTLREIIGQGTLLSGAELIFGETAKNWQLQMPFEGMLLAVLPPGAFIIFGLMIAGKNWIDNKVEQRQTLRNSETSPG